MSRGKGFSALKNQVFRWLFISQTAFFLTMQGQVLVRSMLTYELTGSAISLGLVNFAAAVSMLLVGPWGGVVADRVERRRLLLIGTGALICSESIVLLLFLSGLLQLWHLLLSAVVIGSVLPLLMPAQSAMVVDAVGKRDLQNALALSMGANSATRIVGPSMAGFLVAALGISGAYAVGVGLYFLSLIAIIPVKRNKTSRDVAATNALADLLEGVRYVRDNRLVLQLLLLGIIPLFLVAPFQQLLVVFTESVWDVGSQGLGLLYAISGVGGVLGSIYVARLPQQHARLRLMTLTLVGLALFLAAFALSPWFLLAVPLALAANACTTVFTAVNNASIQILVPDDVRGRVSSFMLMSFSVTPLGTLPMAWVAEHYGAPVAVAGASGLVLLVVAVFVLLSRTLRKLDLRVEEALHHQN